MSSQENLSEGSFVDIKLNVDSLNNFELSNYFGIGLTAKRLNGNTEKTYKLNHGLLSWNNFNIKVDYGTFRNGYVIFDRDKAYRQGKKIKIHITPKNNPLKTFDFEINIPFIKEIKLQYDTTSILAAGYEVPLFLIVTFSNGKVYQSNASFHQSISWNFFCIKHDGEVLFPPVIKIPNRFDTISNSYQICAYALIDSSIKDSIALPLDYKARYRFDFNGLKGFDCLKNANEINGGDGENAERLELLVEPYITDTDTFLKITGVAANKQDEAIINPKDGELTVFCNGGNGGSGCNGGSGGDGGNGGKVIIYCDKEAEKFLSSLYIENRGGFGGPGGISKYESSGSFKKDIFLERAIGFLKGQRWGTVKQIGSNGKDGEWGPKVEIKIIE